jgi:hypothetical protein
MGNELSSREYRHSPPLVAMTIQNISVTIQQSAKLMLKNYQINQSFPFICVTHQHVMLADNTTQLNSFLTNSPIILQVTVQIITEIITEGTSQNFIETCTCNYRKENHTIIRSSYMLGFTLCNEAPQTHGRPATTTH